MAQPQSGIVPEPSASALFLILRVRDPAANRMAVGGVLAQTPRLAAKVAALDRRARLVCTASIGPEFWDVLSPGKRPVGLRPFKAIDAGALSAPNTGGDLLFHVISTRHDLNFELASRLRAALGGRVEVTEEVHGFRYLDGRDLTGFIDGTANPKGKARVAVALIGAEDKAFAGGSYVFTQRYVHDLAGWSRLSTAEQEGAVGRRKRDSKELSGRAKLPTAHIGRVVIEEGGKELEIVRHSFPYGTVSEAGLFFIAYTKTLDTTEKMLARMYGTAGDGLRDRLMDFTRAVSGATFFAPSLQELSRLGRG